MSQDTLEQKQNEYKIKIKEVRSEAEVAKQKLQMQTQKMIRWKSNLETMIAKRLGAVKESMSVFRASISVEMGSLRSETLRSVRELQWRFREASLGLQRNWSQKQEMTRSILNASFEKV